MRPPSSSAPSPERQPLLPPGHHHAATQYRTLPPGHLAGDDAPAHDAALAQDARDRASFRGAGLALKRLAVGLGTRAYTRLRRGCAGAQRWLAGCVAPALRTALAVGLMGTASALFAHGVDEASSRLFDGKYGFCADTDCPSWKPWSTLLTTDPGHQGSLYQLAPLSIAVLLFSGLSHALTLCTRIPTHPPTAGDHEAAPARDAARDPRCATQPPSASHRYAASGSGVVHVKHALAAGQIPSADRQYWTLSTLLVKGLALVFSAASGLVVGKEGPLVHLSASIALLIRREVPALGAALSESQALAVGAAAGLTAAFGTPIAGVVFVMESFRPKPTATDLATLLGSSAAALATRHHLDRARATPRFPIQASTLAAETGSPIDLPLAAAVGVAGGVVGALFIAGVRALAARARGRGHHRRAALDIALVGAATALAAAFAGPLLAGRDAGALVARLLAPPPGVPGAADAEAEAEAGVLALALALGTEFGLAVVTFGLCLPQGNYMPSMAMGALLGRCVGLARGGDPAGGAVLGAAAVLAAVTHLHVTMVVMVVELRPGCDGLVVPVCGAVVLARAVAVSLVPESIYDCAEQQLDKAESL